MHIQRTAPGQRQQFWAALPAAERAGIRGQFADALHDIRRIGLIGSDNGNIIISGGGGDAVKPDVFTRTVPVG